MSKIVKILGSVGFIAFYIGIVIFFRIKFADTSTFIQKIENIYSTAGYPLIFFGAILESMFLVGLFVPGSVVLLLGAAFSKLGIVQYPLVFIFGTSGLIIGYIINYLLGKYGWHNVLSWAGLEKGIKESKARLEKHGAKTILLGYFFPGSASFLSTAAGIIHMPFKKFLLFSILAQSFWSFFWGILAFAFGISLVEFIIKYFIFFLLGGAVLWGVKKLVKR